MITLNFLWHHHQPDYRHPESGETVLPWVRMHAVKGYTDLAAILEHFEHARCTVNFSGILLAQLHDYSHGESRDRYAALSDRRAADLDQAERQFVLRNFFDGNARTMIRPHQRYHELLAKRDSAVRRDGWEQAAARFSDQELTDLLVWFNLAWIGFAGQRRADVIELVARGRDYSAEHQRQVLDIHAELVAAVLPSYRELAAADRIELSFTPHYHPILPLLLDLAAEGHRDGADPLPDFRNAADAAEQIRRGMDWFQRSFGASPRGAWPAEGSVSDATLALLAGAGLDWVATDQQNLPPDAVKPLAHLSPYCWQQDGSRLCVCFRDTRLADNISFEYAGWQGRVAGHHLMGMAREMAGHAQEENPVITIALDGENPWEGYVDGGKSFLSALLEETAASRDIACRTPSEIIADCSWPAIQHVAAGSWIGGNFDIWSRHTETRAAWRRLARARDELTDVCRGPVAEHLLAAEGSDWFWWYGDDFETPHAAQFDELFRAHLIAAYQSAGRTPPEEMFVPIASKRLPAAIGEVCALIEPKLDGRVTTFYEWRGAVRLEAGVGQSAMARGNGQGIAALWYGFSEKSLCLRLDLHPEMRDQLRQAGGTLRVLLTQGEREHSLSLAVGDDDVSAGALNRLAFDQIVEATIDLEGLGVGRSAPGLLAVELSTADGQLARYPVSGRVPIYVVSEDFAVRNWTV